MARRRASGSTCMRPSPAPARTTPSSCISTAEPGTVVIARSRSESRGVAQALAARGIVRIAADYRIYPETVFPGFLDVPAAAVRWTRDHVREFGGDRERIFVMGHSSGAHMADMLAPDP